MTTSDHKKVLAQLAVKPVKYKKFQKHNAPKERSCGIARKKCRRCGRNRAHIDKYGLDLCRQCFREIATRIGFKKYN
ncbi:30S ribosomal protein S14 [Candidatus Woesearchaeota archaeon]|nr:30S ribosomal protein S14 [Candidatus Woesearchaeota archaeon]MBT6520305.1 30S ribosomal protein S14 [Candidatus Woesearchaeota archaeon]MBT7368257.1 30S ribosomal protein S14 [Candidatus Woesearchaeota archaeon]